MARKTVRSRSVSNQRRKTYRRNGLFLEIGGVILAIALLRPELFQQLQKMMTAFAKPAPQEIFRSTVE